MAVFIVFWIPDIVERLPFTKAVHATGNNALMTPGMITGEVLVQPPRRARSAAQPEGQVLAGYSVSAALMGQLGPLLVALLGLTFSGPCSGSVAQR